MGVGVSPPEGGVSVDGDVKNTLFCEKRVGRSRKGKHGFPFLFLPLFILPAGVEPAKE